MRYRRAYVPGGCYFFTVVTANRRPVFRAVEQIALLKQAFAAVSTKHPFRMHALVVLPNHLHCVWSLPENDSDFSLRWRLVKHHFSTRSDLAKPVWQQRFWEHLIRDADDFNNHLDYIHYNPVKHGLVRSPRDWPHSSFHFWVRRERYPADWGMIEPELDERTGRE